MIWFDCLTLEVSHTGGGRGACCKTWGTPIWAFHFGLESTSRDRRQCWLYRLVRLKVDQGSCGRIKLWFALARAARQRALRRACPQARTGRAASSLAPASHRKRSREAAPPASKPVPRGVAPTQTRMGLIKSKAADQPRHYSRVRRRLKKEVCLSPTTRVAPGEGSLSAWMWRKPEQPETETST